LCIRSHDDFWHSCGGSAPGFLKLPHKMGGGRCGTHAPLLYPFYENLSQQKPEFVRKFWRRQKLTPNVYCAPILQPVTNSLHCMAQTQHIDRLHSTDILFACFRMKVTLFCLMNLQKFPFDQQQCPMVLESCKCISLSDGGSTANLRKVCVFKNQDRRGK